MKKRLQFIPELQAQITAQLGKQGVDAAVVEAAFKRWHEGHEAATPWERGCFSVFEQVQKDVAAT